MPPVLFVEKVDERQVWQLADHQTQTYTEEMCATRLLSCTAMVCPNDQEGNGRAQAHI